ncbi:Protein of unknown function [Prauserella marina]|uniref:Uncharacterized protein n=1 Tax=Prauserella marina TaxID=530584 RepID=A0A1G6J3D0_9PSEU|nr:DUF742 domain-containing protein [Prauserella marina]PWV84780.1 uncharacterized protein DUF742 [Prauserella marina]SDC13362.1 Protein of unknown function [Prauserella marina]
MSTGPGRTGDDDSGTFADLVNGFALGPGHRGLRKGREHRGDRGEPRGRQTPPFTEMSHPAGLPGTIGAPTGEEQLVSAEAVPLYPAEETDFVRPYAITGGRTKANYPLELETLVSTREAAVFAVPDQIEHKLIMEECRTPHSVAEIAAALRVPLGVARVLISDAADAGLVTVHRTISGDEGAEAHLMLMERVLSGLRRL